VLPELPSTLILHPIHVIMRYPIRIIVKAGIRKIQVLKLIIGIDNRLHMIPVFYDMKPRKNILLELFRTDILGLVLHIKYRWQVTRLQLNHGKKEISLPTC
jgi:hypothetical protein